jgi:hypothetical protein
MAFHDGDLDSDTANRLLAGRLEPDDAPPGYREVAQLLQDARSWNGLPDVTDDAVIVAIVDAITHPDELARKRKHVLARIVTTKVAVTTAVVALSATGAAAATGSLPDRAQNGLAHAAAHVGIELPEAANDKSRDATPTGADPADGAPGSAGNDAPATHPAAHPADEDATRSGGPGAVPSTAAPGDTAPSHGDVVSQTAHSADATGGKGEEVSPVARDNHGAEVRSEDANGASPRHGHGYGNRNGYGNDDAHRNDNAHGNENGNDANAHDDAPSGRSDGARGRNGGGATNANADSEGNGHGTP